jgi:twinkle protein
MSDITEIKRRLTDRAQEVAEHLLPRGIREGDEWCVGSTGGEPGRSLKVRVRGGKAGTWADFGATGESGDLIDLWCQVKHLSLIAALDDIRAWLGIEAPKFEKRERTYRRPEKPRCTAPRSAVLEYLTGERKLSTDAIRAYRVGEDGRMMVFPSLLPDGTLAFVKHRSVDREPGKQPKTWAEADCEPALFGWQAIDPEAREITFTEGEIDAPTSWDYGFPALSVPFGGGGGRKQGQWIEVEYERLARFETIYLALDMDAEGDAAAEEIANRLGRHRCRRVRLPHKDLNACRQAGIEQAEIRRCFETAKSLDPPELVRAGAFADSVVNLFHPRGGVAAGYVLPWRKIADRVRFLPGDITLWTGATGVGKSQALGHALIGMGEQGARACIASLEMAPSQLLRRMVKQAGNTDRPTEPFIRGIISWFDGWLWLFGLVGKTPVTRIIEVFEYARARYGCDVFAIDSLMRLGVGAEDYEGQEKAVFELVSWAIEKGVHLHLVAHARKAERTAAHSIPEAEDVKGTSEIASNAANILGVWRNRKLEDEMREAIEALERGDASQQARVDELAQKPSVVVNVAKQRNGDWEGKFFLWFNSTTYQYRGAHDDRIGHRFVEFSPCPATSADLGRGQGYRDD